MVFFRKKTVKKKLLRFRNRKIKYHGEINEKNEPDGYGTLYYKNGNIKYQGSFRNGKKNGHGESYFIFGRKIFEGYWENDKKKNYKEILKSGNTFLGKEVKRGDYWTGYGEFLWVEDGLRLKGYWEWNEKNKYYTCFHKNYFCIFYPKSENLDGIVFLSWENGDFYEGEVKKNEFHGFGKYQWKCGDFYLGQWKNGIREGKGIYEFTNEGFYKGLWKKDKMNGDGYFLTKEGESIVGEWKDNIYHKRKKNWFYDLLFSK